MKADQQKFSPGGTFILKLAGWRVIDRTKKTEVPKWELWQKYGCHNSDDTRDIMNRNHPDYIFEKKED